jgi:uncharacterized membrane protein SpoIIM required for sporulation
MNTNDFIKQREADWKRLETLMNPRMVLSAADVRELGILYRAVTSDLALARRDFPEQRVTVYLNQLLTRTHGYIYQDNISDRGRLWRFISQTIPANFRQTGRFTLAAFLLFILPALIGFRLALLNPDVAEPLGLSEIRAILSENETWTDIPPEDRPAAAGFIMTNNIRVALMAFGGGVLFGLFSVYVLAFNGLFIGAVFGLATHYGMGESLFAFVVGHGVIELSVIFMAGGAGLQLGWALLNPGSYTRRDALWLAAQRAVSLALVAIPLLVIAGLIEGFISPTDTPTVFRVGVGLASGGLMYAYLLLAGRAATAPDSGNRQQLQGLLKT